jgi:hypothetical protein
MTGRGGPAPGAVDAAGACSLNTREPRAWLPSIAKIFASRPDRPPPRTPSSAPFPPCCLHHGNPFEEARAHPVQLHPVGAASFEASTPLGYGVIGNTADSGSVVLGSSPGTPAISYTTEQAALGSLFVFVGEVLCQGEGTRCSCMPVAARSAGFQCLHLAGIGSTFPHCHRPSGRLRRWRRPFAAGRSRSQMHEQSPVRW